MQKAAARRSSSSSARSGTSAKICARRPTRIASGCGATCESIAKGPWFLGERFSALDLYIAVMAYWRPGLAWFEANAPKLHQIAVAVGEVPALAPIMAANFS